MCSVASGRWVHWFESHLRREKYLQSQATPPLLALQHSSVSPSMDDEVEARNGSRDNKEKRKRKQRTTSEIEVMDIEDFGRDETLKIRASLLGWYDLNKRNLPWRTPTTTTTHEDEDDADAHEDLDNRAYAVWVSEVMLQQTRVETVIDYYNRWMQKWPTLHHLSLASLEEVNEMWAGLGYYRRARCLLEGAKMISEGKCGFPRTTSALREVPGIGNYTAGAIASIAFKEAVPVVDGNVVRVIARLKAISSNPKHSATIKNIWRLAGQLVDPCKPGDFNQALMELGATICTPLKPICSACPVSDQCSVLSMSESHRSILVTDYPVKVVKAKKRHDFSAVSVVKILEEQDISKGSQYNSRFLLVKRPNEGLLAGLWEFPSVLLDGEADGATRRKRIDRFLKSFKLDTKKNCGIVSREDVGECVHVFTHIHLTMYVELLVLHLKGGMKISYENEDKETMTWRWIDSEALSSMGLTSGVRKVYNMIQKKVALEPHPCQNKKNNSKKLKDS